MKKRYIYTFVVALAVMVSVPSFASRKDEVTLVMVPREDRVQQIGMDIANRYPSLLISYKLGAGGVVSLHGWSGSQWVTISAADFKTGNFFRTGPDSALVVEKAGVPVPESLIPGEWCGEVYKLTTTDSRVLLHLIGQYYDFKFKDWEWFAKRYDETVEGINPEGLNVAWYHRRLNERIKSDDVAGVADLQYWVAYRLSVPAEPEPVVEIETPVRPEMEIPNDPEVDPFASDVPAAVVMGAGAVEISDVPSETMPLEAPEEPVAEE